MKKLIEFLVAVGTCLLWAVCEVLNVVFYGVIVLCLLRLLSGHPDLVNFLLGHNGEFGVWVGGVR